MKNTLLFLFVLSVVALRGQVGVNTTNPQALLDVPASNAATPTNTDGILIPRVSAFPLTDPTIAQHGMMVFLTAISGGNAPGIYYWDNPTTTWKGIVGSVTGGWGLTGNGGITGANFLGTTNAADLIFRTNNLPRMRIDPQGNGRFGMGLFSDVVSGFSRFEIGSEETEPNDLTLRHSGDDHPVFNIIHNKGTKFGSPVRLVYEDRIGEIKFLTYNGGGPSSFGNLKDAGRIGMMVENNTGSISAGIYFKTTSTASTNDMYLSGSGNLGIGTELPGARLHVVGSMILNNGSQANGRILRSGPTGIATWVDPTSIFGGSLDGSYDFPTAGAGRTIIADAGSVTIAGTDGLVSTGTIASGALAPTGNGVKMFWNPRKAAFRAGLANGNFWDDAQIGEGSAAFGSNTRASGNFAFAAGYDNYANGEAATAFGYSNIVGPGSFAAGYFNDASGTSASALGSENQATAGGAIAVGAENVITGNSGIALGIANSVSSNFGMAFGFINSVSGQRATAFGVQNSALAYGETVVGIGATNYTVTANGASQNRTANATDRVFTVGNAIDSNNNNTLDAAERRNALVILKNGLATLPTVTNALITAETTGKAVVTKEWVQTNSSGSLDSGYDFGGAGSGRTITADAGAVRIEGTAGLQVTGTMNTGAVLDLSGAGTRMFFYPRKAAFRTGGAAAAQFDDENIGLYSFASGSSPVASGYGSTATGINSQATTTAAVALGASVVASGSYSFAVGYAATASGSDARAIGRNSNATGDNSVTLGAFTNTSGTGAMATGQSNFASGDFSLVAGYRNEARSIGEAVFGLGATIYTVSANGESQFGAANNADRLFVVGNATDNNNDQILDAAERSNAMTILKNGRVALGNIIPGGQFQLSLDQGRKPGTNTWTIVSDERLKTIHGSYTKGLSEISQLNPILYNYKNVGKRTFEQKVLETEFSGFSAQEVKQIFPEAVGTDDDGYLNLNIHPILIASVNAFKELKSQNENLASENKTLHEKVNRQQAILEALLARVSNLESKKNP